MKKLYTAPTLEALSFLSTEEILAVSEESLDINVSFDSLWGTGI